MTKNAESLEAVYIYISKDLTNYNYVNVVEKLCFLCVYKIRKRGIVFIMQKLKKF